MSVDGDAIDQTVRNHGKEYVFVDTAGVRRRHRVGKGVEELMVRRFFFPRARRC